MSEVITASGTLYPGVQGNGRSIGKFTCSTPLVPVTNGHTRDVLGTATCYAKAGVLHWRFTLDSPRHPAAQELRDSLMNGARIYSSPTGEPRKRAGDLIGELDVRSIAILPATSGPALGRSTQVKSTWETRADAAYRSEVYVGHYEAVEWKANEARRVRTNRVLKQSRQALGSGVQHRDGRILSLSGPNGR